MKMMIKREIRNPSHPESKRTRRQLQVSIIKRSEEGKKERRNDGEEEEEEEFQSSNEEER